MAGNNRLDPQDSAKFREEVEKLIKKVVPATLGTARNAHNSATSKSNRKPQVFNFSSIMKQVQLGNNVPKNVLDFINSNLKELNGISKDSLQKKVFEETILWAIDEFLKKKGKANIVLVVGAESPISLYFNTLKEIGESQNYPDISPDIKQGIIYGVHDLTKKDIKNIYTDNNVWARIITREQFKLYKKMNTNKQPIIIQG